jgi:uncharacterized protein YbaR (Trm112 family)
MSEANDLMPLLVCPWCETAPLVIRHRSGETPNSSCSSVFYCGFYAGCSAAGSNCPDTTGVRQTPEAALSDARKTIYEYAH